MPVRSESFEKDNGAKPQFLRLSVLKSCHQINLRESAQPEPSSSREFVTQSPVCSGFRSLLLHLSLCFPLLDFLKKIPGPCLNNRFGIVPHQYSTVLTQISDFRNFSIQFFHSKHSISCENKTRITLNSKQPVVISSLSMKTQHQEASVHVDVHVDEQGRGFLRQRQTF